MDGEMSSISVPNDANWPTGGGTGTVNLAPSVVVSAAPLGNNAYRITATGSDSDGTVAGYEYWNGTTLVASGAALTSIQLTVTQNSTVTVRVTDNL